LFWQLNLVVLVEMRIKIFYLSKFTRIDLVFSYILGIYLCISATNRIQQSHVYTYTMKYAPMRIICQKEVGQNRS